jgi:hypothetical protein
MIKGTTLVKCKVYDKPSGGNTIRTIGANVVITATENKFQWLHLTEGGWVSAGTKQQYIKWNVVADVPPPPFPPPPISVTRQITEIKQKGRIATLLVVWQSPKWDFTPPQPGTLNAWPHAFQFSNVGGVDRKGARIPLTKEMEKYVERLNAHDKNPRRIIDVPEAGWINIHITPPDPMSIECLTWSANHVVVKETRMFSGVEYASVHALNCYESNLDGTFFDKDMRLVIHKFNAFTMQKTMINIGSGIDCYTPFISNPNMWYGEMWIRTAYIEMWPALPFALNDGTSIVEYELYGHSTYGIRADKSAVLLRDASGFKTNWKINSPDVPV